MAHWVFTLADLATAPATSEPAEVTKLQPTGASPLTIVVVAVTTALIIGWFALRYWLMVTKNKVDKVETPTIDRLNARALEHMVDETPEEAEQDIEAVQSESAPDDLLAAIPPEEEQAKEKAARQKASGKKP